LNALLQWHKRERERRPGESNQRHPAAELALDLADRGQNVRQGLPRLESFDGGEVGFSTQRLFDLRSFALNKVEGDSHRFERQEQIGKKNRRVHVDAAHRL